MRSTRVAVNWLLRRLHVIIVTHAIRPSTRWRGPNIAFDADASDALGPERPGARRKPGWACANLLAPLTTAIRDRRYVEAVSLAEALLPGAWNRDSVIARLHQLTDRREQLLRRTDGAIDIAKAALQEQRFDDADQAWAAAAEIVPDEPSFASLKKRIDAKRTNHVRPPCNGLRPEGGRLSVDSLTNLGFGCMVGRLMGGGWTV